MKAIVHDRYGAPEVLQLREVETPRPAEGQVLVRVHAASINPLDWHSIRGEPMIARPSMGWTRPTKTIPGVDVAGVVEEVGTGVTKFAPGDEVWGNKGRALAEYVCARETLFLPKPARLTMEQAAAIPAAGLTALQALRDHGSLKPGQHVLVNGSSGGVGTFAVQIAKAFGATVTAVCSTPNVELVASLGADDVIDYTAERPLARETRYDLILDNVGNLSLLGMRRALVPNGIALLVGALPARWVSPFPRIARASVLSRFGSRKLAFMLSKSSDDDMRVMLDLVQSGTVTPVIDRCYPLAEAAEAMRYLETLRARGKVIIQVEGQPGR